VSHVIAARTTTDTCQIKKKKLTSNQFVLTLSRKMFKIKNYQLFLNFRFYLFVTVTGVKNCNKYYYHLYMHLLSIQLFLVVLY
jgi:hypothetical protein